MGDLTAAEQAELDALRASDPSVDDEILELSDVLRETAAAVDGWDASAPSGSLRNKIVAIEQGAVSTPDSDADTDIDTDTDTGSDDDSSGTEVLPLQRRPWLVALGAAACVAIGAGGMLLLQPSTPSPPTGPPGTLGAVEEIAFTGEPTGVSVDGSLIAHTWGTETILNITGLTEANPYDVVLVTVDGDSLESGSFLGSSVKIDCEMNAAVMRQSVASIQIQDAEGTVVASADLPTAS